MKRIRKGEARSIGNPEDVRRILIVKPSSLGDIFHVFPAVARLQQLFPQAQFDWLVHPAFAEALDYAPATIVRKIYFRRRELGKMLSFAPEFLALYRELRKERYDYIFDFQGLLRSAICARCAQGKVIGFARPREAAARMFYHDWSKVNLHLHAVRRNQLLVERYFKTGTMHVDCRMPEHPEYWKRVSAKLERSGCRLDAPLIGIAPGARWPSKKFPASLFAKVIRLTVEMLPEVSFVILGAPGDQETAAAIQAECGTLPVHSLAGLTGLGELVELIRRCKVLLSNDSGPVHIASAAAVPVVCFYGPTNPSLTGPFGDIHTIFQRGELECIKCMRRECSTPLPECHKIDAAAVASAIRSKIMEEHVLCSEN